MFGRLKTSILSPFNTVKEYLVFYDIFFFLLLLIFYQFYNSSFSVFFSFLAGMFFCIVLEISLFVRYVLFKFTQRHLKYGIKVLIKNITMDDYFYPDPNQIIEKMKKKEFFMNKYFKNDEFKMLLPIDNVSPNKKPHKDSLTERERSYTGFQSLKDGKDSSFIGPDGSLNKSFTNAADLQKKKKIMKIRYKHLKNEISDILEYFNDLIKLENKYGDILCQLGEPKLFNQNIIIFLEDKNEKSYTSSDFSPEHRSLLKKFLNNKNFRKIMLPNWDLFRVALRTLGKTHKDCASFIKKGVNELVTWFNQEYIQEAEKLNKEKREVKAAHDKSLAYLTKVSHEFKEQKNSFSKLYEIYDRAKNNKEAPLNLIKKESDAKLASAACDSLKIKVREANINNSEANSKLVEMSKKINDFNKDWHRYKQTSFFTILRSIVDAFYENVYQYKDIFNEIIHCNMPESQIPQLKSKKSIILDNQLMSGTFRVSSKKKTSTTLDHIDVIPEKKEFSPTVADYSPNRIKRRATIFPEIKENYVEFNEHLKSLRINVEDEHLKDLEENEIIQIFKSVFGEMTKKFEDYKNKLNDSLRFYREIKEFFVEDLWKSKEFYMNGLMEIFHTKFKKIFQNKRASYLDLFEIILMKLRTYSENFKFYIDDLKEIHLKLTETIKQGEREKKEILDACADHVKEFERFCKNIESVKKTDGKTLNSDLNIECIIKKNNMFPRIDTELVIFQKALDRHAENLAEIKFNYFIKTLDFINQQTRNLDELVEEVDEKYFELLSKAEDYDKTLKEEEYEEDKNDITNEEDIEPNKKHNINNISLIEDEKADNNSEMEDDNITFDPMEIKDPDEEKRLCMVSNSACGFFLSKLLKSFFAEWSQNPNFHERVKKKLYTSFNKKRNPRFAEIKVIKIQIDPTAPKFEEIIQQKSVKNEFLFDLCLDYRGNFCMEIETKMIISNKTTVSVFASIKLKSLTGTIRACFVPLKKGKSWYSFIGEPLVNLEIDPKIGESKISINIIPGIQLMISDLILKKFQKMTYPNRKQLKIPMTNPKKQDKNNG